MWRETVGRSRVSGELLLGTNLIHRYEAPSADVERSVRDNALDGLQLGEQECIYVCWREQLSTFLTDDLAARYAARRLGLTPVGSLGIVVRAYREGVISLAEAESFIRLLQDVSSLFVTHAIIDLALERLHGSLNRNASDAPGD